MESKNFVRKCLRNSSRLPFVFRNFPIFWSLESNLRKRPLAFETRRVTPRTVLRTVCRSENSRSRSSERNRKVYTVTFRIVRKVHDRLDSKKKRDRKLIVRVERSYPSESFDKTTIIQIIKSDIERSKPSRKTRPNRDDVPSSLEKG